MGIDSEANERFTELLKLKLPDYKVLAAGVAGFGTDQEYLLLKRLWPKVKPAVVVLIFCSDNDRLDNRTNKRYFDLLQTLFRHTAGWINRGNGTAGPEVAPAVLQG